MRHIGVVSVHRPPSGKRITDELLVGFESHVEQTWRPILLDQIRMLQEARTPQGFANLHTDLLARFAARQDVASERRASRSDLQAEQQKISQQAPKPKEQLRELQGLIRSLDELDFRDGVLQHVARCVADGMVWRLVGADRRALAILGDRSRVGRLPDAAGFAAERAQIEAHAAAGRLAIHNDLTNCLREGDLTVLGPEWPPRTIRLQEVKARAGVSSKLGPDDRLTRQANRLDRKLKILRDNYDPDAASGAGVRLLRLPVLYRTHLHALDAVLQRARTGGHASEVVSDGVLVSAVDYTTVGDVRELGYWQRDDPVAAWGPLATDRRVQGSTFVQRYEDRRRDHRNYQAVAPVSLLPLHPEEITDVLLGRVDVCVTYRFDAIEAALASRGIEARCAGPDAWNERLLVAERGEATVTVPPHFGQQFTQELMTIETLADVVETLIELASSGQAAKEWHMVFCDEREAWPGLVR